MKELIFRLRIFRSQTVMTDEFYTEVSYEVDCLSFRAWPLNDITATERFECGREQMFEEFEKRGWEKAGTRDYFVLIISLPLSGHELVELPDGILSSYWSRESLLDLFNQANAEFSSGE